MSGLASVGALESKTITVKAVTITPDPATHLFETEQRTFKVAGDATAELSIRDHGIGIAPADRARIFEQFQRGAASKSDGGFGVGLWITRQLVLAMGGEISVASDLGVGSTFNVVLPLNPKSSHVDSTQ